MAGSLKTFEDLECWQAATEVRRFVMQIVKKFSPEEKYSLTDDRRRASRSRLIILQKDLEGFTIKKTYSFADRVEVLSLN